MRLGNYTLEIVGGTERTGGYVALVHGQKYRVRLQNHGTRKCDAKLVIDGTEMGTFRVDPGKHVEIEHPSHSSGCFTFFELAMPEAHLAGLKSMPLTGLVSVTFMPEMQQSVTLASPPNGGITLFSAPAQGHPPQQQDGAAGLAPGGSGLSGQSRQTFNTVASIQYAPAHEFVTITLRLGGAVAQDIRPLVPQPLATPVPPPLT